MVNPVIERECFKSGDIIRHFKRDFCTEEEKNKINISMKLLV